MKITNEVYAAMLSRIICHGLPLEVRGLKTVEIINQTSVFPMETPLVTIAARRLGYRFACAEAAWILSGDNRLAPLVPYSAAMAQFSDDGRTLRGAYGPRVIDQLPYVIEALERDPFCRQAIMTIWRERPAPSKDIPCTVAIQFLIRDNQLHLINTMRSSDAWLGVPYDVFSFSMVGAFVAIALRKTYPALLLGDIYMNAGSRHLYTGNEFGYTMEQVVEAINVEAEDLRYAPMDLAEFERPHDLVETLWARAEKKPCRATWLWETYNFTRSKKDAT